MSDSNLEDRIIVKVSDDRKRAWLVTPGGDSFDRPELEAALSRAGVVKGVNPERLRKAASGEILTDSEPIAEFIPPSSGIDAEIRYIVTDEVKPLIRSDGSFNFRELNLVKNIIKGQTLIVKKPPRAGESGSLVTGEEIPGIMGNDLQLKQYAGPGADISERDENAIIALMDGVYCRDEKGKVSILGIFRVDGDVDYNTGNIYSDSDVVVKGDAKSGFSIKCTGNLFIGGLVDDAELIVGGDLNIAGGITKGEALIEAEGALKAMFIYSRNTVKAGKVAIREVISFSNILSGGDVSAKRIVGGEVKAKANIEAEEAGSDTYESRTLLTAGYDLEKIHRLSELEARSAELNDIVKKYGAELEKHKEWLTAYKKRSDTLARGITEMSDSGVSSIIRDKIRQRLDEIRESKRKYDEIRQSLKDIAGEIEAINRELRNCTATVKISGMVFAGVRIAVGNSAHRKIEEHQRRAVFRLDDEYNVVQADF